MTRLTVQLAAPVMSVNLADPAASRPAPQKLDASTLHQATMQEMQRRVDAQLAQLSSAMAALAEAAADVSTLRQRLTKESEEQMVELALGIARKVLMQEIQASRYDIDQIVRQMLSAAPARQEISVHLNPDDLAACKLAQGPEGQAPGLKFVADPSINRAECLVQTPEGDLESTIETNLQGIAVALRGLE